RMALLESEGLGAEEALAVEYGHGVRSLAEAAEGVARFTAGHGRHGTFTDL
ncbi:MAG: enoyl-CoA hydratase, partial [Actinomadura rubrobrunea]|nr:enoyl-CoA hydratase [Actinomadura rubrobrunea]